MTERSTELLLAAAFLGTVALKGAEETIIALAAGHCSSAIHSFLSFAGGVLFSIATWKASQERDPS